jgi:hypothetical protein
MPESPGPFHRGTLVTPTLWLGDGPAGATEVTTAGEAAEVILAGGVSILPADSWVAAEKTLVVVTGSERIAHERVHLAKTGRFPR